MATTMEPFGDTDGDGLFDQRFQVRLAVQLLSHDTMSGTASFNVRSLDGQTLRAGPFGGFTVEARRMRVEISWPAISSSAGGPCERP